MLFETPHFELKKLVARVRDGEIQLPDFQRPWKWDDGRIAALLATVARGYPLGVMMTLEMDGELRFKPRFLDGAETTAPVKPAELLMDGQQRLTSLFQSLFAGKPVETMDSRRKKMLRWYYIDIARSVHNPRDMEDAIVSVPEDRRLLDSSGKRVVTDLTTPENERAAGLFPLSIVYSSKARSRWRLAYQNSGEPQQELWESFEADVLSNIDAYTVPFIRLTKNTPKDAVCTVFENVNTKGIQLTVFELLTASYAADPEYYAAHDEDFDLRDEWKALAERLSKHSAVSEIDDTDFLRAVCLISTHHQRKGNPEADAFRQPAASCKRSDILVLELSEYLRWAPEIESALEWSARFLDRQGIFFAEDLPYRSQLSALAAIRAVLGAEADEPESIAKITRWYWCGVLGEQYSGGLDSRLPRDLEQVVGWVRGGWEPSSVTEASFHAARLDTLSTRNSAAYKGIYALLLREGCVDWIFNRDTIDATLCIDQQADVGLIFPKRWCVKHGIKKDRRDSIVNKTVLASRTLRVMGDDAPSAYLERVQAEIGAPPNWVDDSVSTHLIDPALLREDNFNAFYSTRSAALLELIESAMGRPAVPAEAAPESVDDYEQEQPE